MLIDQQWHGYRRGHQLLATTIELPARDQDLLDKLSDASGAPRPGERFEPYITVYPLPSGQYNVVARTWQDLEAPRSGTVFTRSLIVQAAVWRTIPNIRPLFAVLDSRDITNEQVPLIEQDVPWPTVTEPALAPLIEAMFLERAAAIAAFGFHKAETISGRLIEALWPGRRANFALCTHAMGPRSLLDRDFDLIFAPEASRSRFAKWGGRKISAGQANTLARHDWTDQIQARVFEDSHPNLQELDEIGALDASARGDSSALRLALRWSELKLKAATTPTSLLAMLDILSSLGRSPWSVPSVVTLMTTSLKNASNDPSPEAWQFLQLLVRKLGTKIPLGILRVIFDATQRVARDAPSTVLDTESVAPSTPMPHVLRPAVARGLAQLNVSDLTAVLCRLEPTLALSLMAESPDFAETTAATLSIVPNDRLLIDLAAAAANDQRAARRIAGGVSRGSRASAIAPLLKVALSTSPAGNFERLSSNVLAVEGEAREAVVDTLIEIARSLAQEEILRNLALHAEESEGDRIFIRLVDDRASASWLIDKLADRPERLLPLVIELIKAWSDPKLRDIAREGRNRDTLVEASLSGLPGSGKTFTRLLRVGEMSSVTKVSLLRKAAPDLSSNDMKDALLAILDHLMSLDPKSNWDLIEPMLSWADPTKLMNAATSTALNGAQVGLNVAAIARSKSATRFIPVTDLLTSRLVERRSGGYGALGYDSWALFLRMARQSHPEALVRSADAALDYALARPREPAGAVVAAAFPVVHARIKKDSLPDVPFNLITAVLMLPVVLFTDWDKSKAARHGLVDAFLRSNWEPVELLRAAVDADITRKVLGYLASKPGGRDYIRSLEVGIRRQPEPTRRRLAAALDDFRSNGS